MAQKGAGEKIVVDIFTALLGILSICAAAGTICKILLREPKVWDDEDWFLEDTEAAVNYDSLRKEKPHIWID
jgi:hypothetical protein